MSHRITYRFVDGVSHQTLTVFVNGACAGQLTVRTDEVDVLSVIAKTLKENMGTETVS